MPLSPADFGASFKGFLDQMATQGPAEDPPFVRRLRDHFEADPTTLPVVAEAFASHDHPDVQVALDDFLARDGCAAEILGINGPHKGMGISLSDLVTSHVAGMARGAIATEGPVEYVNIPLETGRVLTGVQCGLYLVRDDARRLAVLVRGPGQRFLDRSVAVEVMAPRRADAEQFLAGLRVAMRRQSVYRGRVLSLGQDEMHGLRVKFHTLPAIDRAAIILPDGLLERIERQTVGFGRQAPRLRAAGRHLKRGLLLHGPPGTGKTLSAMYLAGAMRDRTVLLLTGRGLGQIQQSCAMARALQPATVILEDVDLVAEERTRAGAGCASPLLFELLNEMDGLADDADVLFLLTTNRPDLLEPALAARPGRVDQAILIPLPDASCRRRLFDLYGQGLDMRVADRGRLVERTAGASAAFIRELMRKAALFAADEGPELVVADRHLDEALHELVVEGGELTKSLLGFQPGP